MRSIKDHDLTLAWRTQMRTPDKVVGNLLPAWLLETEDECSLRVHSAEYMSNDAVLAGGIKGLQHDKQRLIAICIKQVLQLA